MVESGFLRSETLEDADLDSAPAEPDEGVRAEPAGRHIFSIDLDQRDEAGNTSLHHAVESGDRHAARSLVESGASVNAVNRCLAARRVCVWGGRGRGRVEAS